LEHNHKSVNYSSLLTLIHQLLQTMPSPMLYSVALFLLWLSISKHSPPQMDLRGRRHLRLALENPFMLQIHWCFLTAE
jgi:hypothetical protein